MEDIGRFLAPYRIAVWYDHRGNYLQDMGRLWHLLRKLSSEVDWDSISPSRTPVLPVYFGNIVDHQFTIQEVGQQMVWCSMVGAPDNATRTQVKSILERSELDGLLRVDSDPPSPHHPSFSLILYGLLTYETLIIMEASEYRRYEPIIGLETVYPRDGTEIDLITVLSGDEALPTLIDLVPRHSLGIAGMIGMQAIPKRWPGPG